MNNITDSKINSPAPDRDRKHRETIRVVSNDIGCGGYARPSAFMKYLQDTASMQHEMNPPTTAELRAEMQRAFIMSRISLSIKADLREHDEIDCFAWIAPIKGMSIDRCYEISRGGEIVALGAAVWAVCDTETRRFVRPEQKYFGFGFAEPHGFSCRRIAIPRDIDMEEAGEFRVAWSAADMNRHLNNTVYADMFCDFMPEGALDERRITEFTISFLREAPLGELLSISRVSDGGEPDETYYFTARLSDGNIAAEASFRLVRPRG
ncbi:MAG: acyl-ACP thioesterase domain-containing protein [Eubacteriales bacterium]|jgi:medium-chain acyl-[acyl-carrier-protein] hydrolase